MPRSSAARYRQQIDGVLLHRSQSRPQERSAHSFRCLFMIVTEGLSGKLGKRLVFRKGCGAKRAFPSLPVLPCSLRSFFASVSLRGPPFEKPHAGWGIGRHFYEPWLVGDEGVMFGIPVLCWLAIDFWQSGVYTGCRLNNIKVLKRRIFV